MPEALTSEEVLGPLSSIVCCDNGSSSRSKWISCVSVCPFPWGVLNSVQSERERVYCGQKRRGSKSTEEKQSKAKKKEEAKQLWHIGVCCGVCFFYSAGNVR